MCVRIAKSRAARFAVGPSVVGPLRPRAKLDLAAVRIVAAPRATMWVCAACENEVDDDAAAACDACDEPKPAFAAPATLIAVALVVAIEAVPGKDKLRIVRLDTGAGGEPICVVTSAPNVAVGLRCVVALPGATVPLDGDEVQVKAQVVGGVRSHGMLCDGPMLKWVGGGAGMAALVPEGCALGSAPPATRPRLK